jgi:hypothetical protein
MLKMLLTNIMRIQYLVLRKYKLINDADNEIESIYA